METAFLSMLKAVGERLQIGELQIHGDNNALLGIENTLVSLQYLPQADQIFFSSFVAEIPQNASPDMLVNLYETLLEGQAFYMETAGGSLAINKKLGFIFLQLALPLRIVDVENMIQLLENFVRVAEHWELQCSEIIKHYSDEAQNTAIPSELTSQTMLRI